MKKLRELHAQIDKEYDDKSLALEEEYGQRSASLKEGRERDHIALDRWWTSDAGSLGTATKGRFKNGDNGWPAFMANDAIQSLIENCNSDEKINVNWVFNRVIQQDPQLKLRRPQIIRTQISRALLKFADEGLLEFVRKGKGGQPHIYRRVTKQAVGATAAGQ